MCRFFVPDSKSTYIFPYFGVYCNERKPNLMQSDHHQICEFSTKTGISWIRILRAFLPYKISILSNHRNLVKYLTTFLKIIPKCFQGLSVPGEETYSGLILGPTNLVQASDL